MRSIDVTREVRDTRKTPILGVFSLLRESKDEVIPRYWRSRKQVKCLFEIHRGQNRTTHSGVCSSREHVWDRQQVVSCLSAFNYIPVNPLQ